MLNNLPTAQANNKKEPTTIKKNQQKIKNSNKQQKTTNNNQQKIKNNTKQTNVTGEVLVVDVWGF